MFRNKNTGEVKTEQEIRAAFPNTSFPRIFKADDWEAVLPTEKPSPSTPLRVVYSTGPVKDGEAWVEGWAEQDMFQDTVDATKEEQETAYLAVLAEKDRKEMLALAAQELITELAAIRGAYTQEEIDTFNTQESEAVAWANDLNAPTPLIDGIIAHNGRAKADQVSRILFKASAYKAAVGAAIGRKQSKEM